MNSLPKRYPFLLGLISPLVLIHLLHHTFFRGGKGRYLKQRLGLGYESSPKKPVWIHAASVGEVNAIIPLLCLLIDKYPTTHWLVTTNTTTGAYTVKQKLGNNVEHCYLPLDYRRIVERFLKHYQPPCGLIVETELWPNLYKQSTKHSVPLCLINGRLSKRSLHMPPWLVKVAAFCLSQIELVLARGQQDLEGFIQLGADPKKARVVGNIKYAAEQSLSSKACDVVFDRPIVLAASTHNDEELQLARVWRSLKINSHILVIAPRYPDRRNEILKDISDTKLSVAVHSRADTIKPDTDVYLVDTLGELQGFMQKAELVFMGGSLVPRGGQNILEPAKLGKAIITGPHCFTFAEDIEALQQADAIICINNIDELKNTLSKLLKNPEAAQQLGGNALRFMDSNADVAKQYLEAIEGLGWLSDQNQK